MPQTLFQIATPLAMLGWFALALNPVAPKVAQIAAMAIPLLLSLLYAAVILVYWAGSDGGFDTLEDMQRLFTNAPLALAGWVHYLAFDLMIGAWIARTALAEGINHLFILPCLALTFLFGPAGLFAFAIVRFALTGKVLP